MHRSLVPRIHAKSTETQGNAAKIVFVDLNGWQHRPKPLAPRAKRNQQCTVYNRLHDAVIRVYDDPDNVIEMHKHKGDFKEP
jgi:hypothetical protein